MSTPIGSVKIQEVFNAHLAINQGQS